jgi:hypothetical protein
VKNYQRNDSQSTFPFTAEQIYNHFSSIFSNSKTQRLPEDLFPTPAQENITANRVTADETERFKFTTENVKKAFMSISNNSSAGPDKIEIKTIKDVDSDFSIHCQIFNIQLLYGKSYLNGKMEGYA